MFSRVVALSLPVALSISCATTYDAKWDEKPVAKEATADDATKAAALVAEGDALWAERSTEAKLAEGIAKWEAAAAIQTTPELAVKLARGHYFLGDGYYALQDKAEARDA